MKILQINCSANGSTGRIASDIHQKLMYEGVESYFAYGTGTTCLSNTFAISNQFDFRLHTYLGRITGLHGYFSVLCTKQLIRKIGELKPTIVHLHNLHGGYLNIAMLARSAN